MVICVKYEPADGSARTGDVFNARGGMVEEV